MVSFYDQTTKAKADAVLDKMVDRMVLYRDALDIGLAWHQLAELLPADASITDPIADKYRDAFTNRVKRLMALKWKTTNYYKLCQRSYEYAIDSLIRESDRLGIPMSRRDARAGLRQFLR